MGLRRRRVPPHPGENALGEASLFFAVSSLTSTSTCTGFGFCRIHPLPTRQARRWPYRLKDMRTPQEKL